MDKEYWAKQLKHFIYFFKFELKRTKALGQEMLLASRTNGQLNEVYYNLGKHCYQSLKEGQLQWNTPQVQEFCQIIEHCQQDLIKYEEQLEKIKQQKSDQ